MSQISRIVRKWHGHAGVAATVFLILLVVTGIILNHEEALKLDKREISTGWLMRWYGIHAANPVMGYTMGDRYFSWEGEKWALGDKPLAGTAEHPVGAVAVNGMHFVATSSALYLFQTDGQLVDKLEKQALPAFPVLALGLADDRVVLQTPAGMMASIDGLTWNGLNGKKINTAITWSALQPLPDDTKRQMTVLLAPGLSLERILLDVHSGRIFGRFGPWVIDAAAIALLLLGISGIWIYVRAIKQGRLRHKHH